MAYRSNDRTRELSFAHNSRYVEQRAGNAGHPNAVALNDVFWQEASRGVDLELGWSASRAEHGHGDPRVSGEQTRQVRRR